MASRSSSEYESFTNSLLRKQCLFFKIFSSCFLLQFISIMWPGRPFNYVSMFLNYFSLYDCAGDIKNFQASHSHWQKTCCASSPHTISEPDLSCTSVLLFFWTVFSGFPLISVKALTAFCLFFIQTFFPCSEKPCDKLVLFSFSWWNIPS